MIKTLTDPLDSTWTASSTTFTQLLAQLTILLAKSMKKVAKMNTKETCSNTVLVPNCGNNTPIKKKAIPKESAFHAVMDIKQFLKIRSQSLKDQCATTSLESTTIVQEHKLCLSEKSPKDLELVQHLSSLMPTHNNAHWQTANLRTTTAILLWTTNSSPWITNKRLFN